MGTIVHRTVTNEIAVHGTRLAGYLDGQKLLDDTRATPVSGKVGVWSKTDSIAEPAKVGDDPAKPGGECVKAGG